MNNLAHQDRLADDSYSIVLQDFLHGICVCHLEEKIRIKNS